MHGRLHVYYCEPSAANVLITGVSSSAPRTSVGFAYIRVGVDKQSRLLRLPTMSTDNISGGATQVLLHAATCKRLGMLAFDLHGSDVPLIALPGLPSGSDEHWIRQHKVATSDGPSAMTAAAANISSYEVCRGATRSWRH